VEKYFYTSTRKGSLLRVKEVEDYFTSLNTSLTYCPDSVIRTYMSRVSMSDKQEKGRFKKSKVRVVSETNHSLRVGLLCRSFVSDMLHAGDSFQNFMYVSGLLHDIGKQGVPSSILTKACKLTEDEWVIVKNHSKLGADLLASSLAFHKYAEVVLHHHEREDGSGYPNNLTSKEICIGSKILCIVDSFDAMISKRAYSDAMNVNHAVDELQENSGVLFNKDICSMFTDFVSNNCKNMFEVG
jgi:HD-GYP domain-containing protein (c-di-GMP phosphodiesterase class II)